MRKNKSFEDAILQDTVRRSYNQKSHFIELLNSFGIKYTIDDCKLSGWKNRVLSIFKSRNIIIGNIDKAKYIITAHYDTPSDTRKENKIRATRKEYNKYLFSYYSIRFVLMLLIVVCMVLFCCYGFFTLYIFVKIINKYKISNDFSKYISFIIDEEIKNSLSWFNHYSMTFCQYLMLFLFVLLSILFYRLYKMFFSNKGNPSNVNDNTSGILALFRTYYKFKNNKNVAYVLFDNEEKRLIGSTLFYKKYKNMLKNKTIINIDSVGDGQYFVIGYSNSDIENRLMNITKRIKFSNSNRYLLIENINKLNKNSDHHSFKNGDVISIGAYHKDYKNILSMRWIHTHKDKFGEDYIDKNEYYCNINLVSELMIKYCK